MLPPERELTRLYRAGRSSVREALRMLESQGVVVPAGGALVVANGARPLERSLRLADDIVRFMSDNARHRDMLRQHSVELAAAREQELKVINAEAQRCRTELSRKDAPETQPAPPPPPRTARRKPVR